MGISAFLNSDAFGPGGLKRLPDVLCLSEDDQRFNDFRNTGFDISAILAWVNHRNAICRRNRIQVLTSFPILVPVLAMHDERSIPTLMEVELEVAIDRGDVLIDAIVRIIGISKASVRFLRGQSPAHIGREWIDNVLELFWAIEFLLPKLRPNSACDWITFRAYWVCANLSGNWRYRERALPMGLKARINVYMFIELCRYGYEEFALNRLRRIAEGGLTQIKLSNDYFRFVNEWLDYARTDKDMPNSNLSEGLLMRYSMKELLRQSARWHRKIWKQTGEQLLEDAPPKDSIIGSWPGVLPEPIMVNGLQAVSLTCAEDLRQEGHHLDHCVESHVESCLSGSSHILSIRNRHGISHSTVELELIPDGQAGWRSRVLQHYGFGNSDPDQACISTLNQVLRHLREPAMQEHLSKIQRFHEDRRDALEAHLAVYREETKAVNTAIMRAVLPDFDAAVAWIDENHMRSETLHQARL